MLLTLISNLGYAAGIVVPEVIVNVGGGKRPEVRTISGDNKRDQILREDEELMMLIKRFIEIV